MNRTLNKLTLVGLVPLIAVMSFSCSLRAQDTEVEFILKRRVLELVFFNRSENEVALPSEVQRATLPDNILLISGDTIILSFEDIKAEFDIYGAEVLNKDDVYFRGPGVPPGMGLVFKFDLPVFLARPKQIKYIKIQICDKWIIGRNR